MEKKKKGVASIPANYVSILELQERWMREKKEEKHKEKGLVERGLVDDEQGKREEEGMEPRVKLEDKNLGGGVNLWEKKSLDGEEPKCVEKEKLEDGENGGDWRQKRSKKKKNQGGSKEKVANSESKASPAYIRKENNPAKEEIKTPNVVRDSVSVESQFQKLCINKKVEDEKGSARLNNGKGYERKQRHSSTHVIKTSAMVWVKKEKSHGADGGSGSENGV